MDVTSSPDPRASDALIETLASYASALVAGRPVRFRSHRLAPLGGDWTYGDEGLIVSVASDEAKSDYRDILEFWLYMLYNALEDRWNDDRFEEHVAGSICRLIPERDSESIIATMQSRVIHKDSIHPDGEHRQSLSMFDAPNRIALVVDTAREYRMLFWERRD
jgi:hypothetical protein